MPVILDKLGKSLRIIAAKSSIQKVWHNTRTQEYLLNKPGAREPPGSATCLGRVSRYAVACRRGSPFGQDQPDGHPRVARD